MILTGINTGIRTARQASVGSEAAVVFAGLFFAGVDTYTLKIKGTDEGEAEAVSINVDWGDGTAATSVSFDGTLQTVTHDYPALQSDPATVYPILITGKLANITEIEAETTGGTCNLIEFRKLKNIERVTVIEDQSGTTDFQSLGDSWAALLEMTVDDVLVYQKWIIPVTGQTSGTPTDGTMVFSADGNIDVEYTGDVVETSLTRADDSTYRSHTIVFGCPNNGSGSIVVKAGVKVVSLGNHRGAALNPNVNIYAGTDATSPKVILNITNIPSNVQKIHQTVNYNTILTGSGKAKLPSTLTYLYHGVANLSWEQDGALPSGMTYLTVLSSAFKWVYTGTLPSGLNFIDIRSNEFDWTSDQALPSGIFYLYLNGAKINWTAFDASGTGNMTTYFISNFVTTSMTAAQLLSLLTSMANRTGNLPATCTINDYDNNPTAADIAAATGDPEGSDAEKIKHAIDQIFANKATTRITLQGVNIDKPA
jgi:hypothetical protein